MTRTIHSPPVDSSKSLKLLAGRIITASPITGILRKPFLADHTILISRKTGRILSVTPTTDSDTREAASPDSSVIDLRGKTVLPGFIDTHVHCEFHGEPCLSFVYNAFSLPYL